MPENDNNQDQNNGGSSGSDVFVPSAEFSAEFSNTPIGGADEIILDENNNDETPEAKTARLEAEKFAGKTPQEIEVIKQKEISDKVASDEKIENEKIAKMAPEEKEKYLAEKNKSTSNNSTQVKPFEEELLSRFEGKYKTVDQIQEALKNPQKVEVFADEAVKNINEYVKNGGKLDAAYLEAITTDYAAMQDGVEIAMRHLQATDPKFKNADSEELEYEVRSRYKMDEWSEDGAEEVNEVRKIMSKRIEREAEQFRTELIEKQNSLKFIKPIDPKIAENVAAEKATLLKDWVEKIVPEVVSKIPKLSTVLLDKDGKPTTESFDYTPDKADKDEVVRITNSMGENAKEFWGQFYDKDGKFDHTKLVRMMMRDRGYDKAVQLVREQGRAAGFEEGIKSIKGIDFTPDKRGTTGAENLTLESAIAKSLSENT